MYRNNKQKLTDIVMGDAVLALLNTSAEVTTRALLNKLREMAFREQNTERADAIHNAMAEVRKAMHAREHNAAFEMKDRNNVTHLFRDDEGSGNSRKH